MRAAWLGEDDVSANVAPTALYIALWIGMQVVSAVLGDVWRRINPLWTIAAVLDRTRRRDPERSTATGWWGSHWPAAVGLLAFHWPELVYFEPATLPAVHLFLRAYAVRVSVAASVFTSGSVRPGAGIDVLFSLLGAHSPLFRL